MTVLVGYVARPESEKALKVGIEEAVRRRLPLHIVHVLEHEIGDSPTQARREVTASEAVETHLRAVAERLTADGIEVSTEVRHGLPGRTSQALLDAAREADAGLVVLGLRPRSKVEKLVLGSVAREVLMAAPCPVLTVKA